MRLLLNVIWLIFGGLWLALGYFVAGIVCCILIVTIPFGIAAFRIGVYALWPFGRTVVDKPTAGVASVIGNVIWIVVAGIWLAIGHILTAIAMAITIIGIPFAWGLAIVVGIWVLYRIIRGWMNLLSGTGMPMK